MIGKHAPTGMKVAPPSREQLKQADDEAWGVYGAICWDPIASGEDRAKAFAAAIDSTNALLEFDKKLRLAT